MSSIITFTYNSKWNHLIFTSLRRKGKKEPEMEEENKEGQKGEMVIRRIVWEVPGLSLTFF
jgi:hypothetical protein